MNFEKPDFSISMFASSLDLLTAESTHYKDRCAFLENLLYQRDGGSHDADCKIHYGRPCNCGHEEVQKYFFGFD